MKLTTTTTTKKYINFLYEIKAKKRCMIYVRNTEWIYCISQVIEYTWVPFI